MSAVAEKLPKTMAAIMCHGPKDYRLEERAVPKPGPGEVDSRQEYWDLRQRYQVLYGRCAFLGR